MSRLDYRFERSWTLAAPVGPVLAALEDVEGYERWWPSVVEGERTGPRSGWIAIRGALPVRIRIHLREVVADDRRLVARIDGDLLGVASWRVESSSADRTRIRFDQQVRVRRRDLRFASSLAHELLAWNHGAAMRSLEAGLERELGSSRPAPR